MIVSTMKFTYTSGDRPLEGFTIKRGIGAGGFGEVYYAVTDAGKEVALKLVQHSHDVELRGVNQCLNLKNPHLISLYDVKRSDDGETWVVMEYMAGESLEEALDRNPTGLETEEALRWMHGIAEAVDYLHDRGIVHRDLKPANMFLEDGLIKVGDYGLAKFVSASRRSGHTESVGTVHYMAPEVANGRYGKELDVYAAGIIFYEMLTGRVPFEGESVAEILMKHLTAEPDLSALDKPFRPVLARALAKDPAQRYDSLGRMLGDLEAAGVRLNGVRSTRRSSADHRTGAPNRSADQATRAWSPAGGAARKSRFDNVWSAFFREDPVMRLIRRTWQAVWPKLESSPLLLILATIVAVFLTVEGALPFLAMCVLIYIAVALPFRWFTRLWWSPRPLAPSGAAPPKPPVMEGVPEVGAATHESEAVPPAAPVVPVRHAAKQSSKSPMGPVTKSVRRKLSELSTSLFVATLLAFLIAVAMAVVLDFDRPEEVVLLGAVGAVGSWAVLIPAKWWEGTQGDTVVRRLVMLGLGAGVGVVAAAGSNFLLVSLPNEPSVQVELDLPVNWHRQVSRFYDPGGEPLRGAYAIFYASLFLVPRWWKQADPYRKRRFRFGPLFGVGIWALLISAFWEFSDPWGVACAVLIASVVQLASSWHPEELAPVRAKEVAA